MAWLCIYYCGNGVSIGVQALAWFGSTVIQTIEILSPFIAILGTMYATYRLVTFAIAAYNLVTNGAKASTMGHVGGGNRCIKNYVHERCCYESHDRYYESP